MNENQIEEIFKLAELVHTDYQALKAELEDVRARIKSQKEQLQKLYVLLR